MYTHRDTSISLAACQVKENQCTTWYSSQDSSRLGARGASERGAEFWDRLGIIGPSCPHLRRDIQESRLWWRLHSSWGLDLEKLKMMLGSKGTATLHCLLLALLSTWVGPASSQTSWPASSWVRATEGTSKKLATSSVVSLVFWLWLGSSSP